MRECLLIRGLPEGVTIAAFEPADTENGDELGSTAAATVFDETGGQYAGGITLVGSTGEAKLYYNGFIDVRIGGTGSVADDLVNGGLPRWLPRQAGVDPDQQGGGTVASVNGQTGVVVLDAADVGADAAGTAAGLVDAEGVIRAAADGELSGRIGAIESLMDVVPGAETLVPGTNPTSDFPTSENHHEWAFGIYPNAIIRLVEVNPWLLNVTANDTLRLTIYSRPITDNQSTVPGNGAGDVQLQQIDYPAADVATDLTRQRVNLPFTAIETETDKVYLFRIYAIVGGGDGVIGIGRYFNSSVLPQYEKGWFRRLVANMTANVSSFPVTFGYTTQEVSYAIPPSETANQAIAALNDRYIPVVTEIQNNHYDATDTANLFCEFVLGYKAVAAQTVDRVVLPLYSINTALNERLRLDVYRRPAASVYTGGPSLANGDELLSTTYVQTADLLQIATEQTVVVDFPAVELAEDDIVLLAVRALRAADVAGAIGIGTNVGAAYDDQYRKGFYKTRTSGVNYTPITGRALSFTLLSKVKTADDIAPVMIDSVDATTTVTGLDIAVSATVDRAGYPVLVAGTVTMAPTTSGSDVVVLDLPYAAKLRGTFDGAWLGHRRVSNVVVTRVSDSATLTSGVDYEVDLVTGAIRGIPNIPDYSVSVALDYDTERYDLIQYDPITLAVSAVTGTDRDYDPQEYIPAPDAGKIPLYHALAYGATVELVPVYRAKAPEVTQPVTALAALAGKIGRGETITLVGYGDSITAIQDSTTFPSVVTPNGIYRDVLTSYLGLFPADTLATIPLYDHGDGAGQIHTHVGWCWTLKSYLEQIGATVDYLNFGLGGTTTESDAYNGLYAPRLAAVTGSNPDITVLAFGANEIDRDYTYTNTVAIIEALQAVGSVVVVMGVPRSSQTGGHDSMRGWRKTNRLLALAANDTGSLFINTVSVADDEFIDGLGIHPDHLSAADFYVHPGLREYAIYGQLLVDAVAESLPLASGTSARLPYHGIVSAGTPIATGNVISCPGAFAAFDQGTPITDTAPAVEIVTPVIGTRYFVSYDTVNGGLKYNTTGLDIKTDIIVCIAMTNGTSWAIEYELHNHTRNLDWHRSEHYTEGAAFDAIYDGGAAEFTDTTLSIAQTRMFDEDIHHDTGGTITQVRVWYQVSAGVWSFDEVASSVAAKIVAGALKYDADGVLTSVTDGYFVRNDVYHTNHTTLPINLVVGQGQYTTQSEPRFAPARRPAFFAESKRLYRTIWKNNGGTPQLMEEIDWRYTPDTSFPVQSMATVAKPAASMTRIAGQAETGTVANTWANDGTNLVLNENNTNPSLTEEFTFPVTAPVLQFVASSYYTGTGTGSHIVDLKVWDAVSMVWTVLGQMPLSAETNQIFSLNDTRHRSGGIVKIRAEHRAGVGNTSHDAIIDYMAVVQSDYSTLADHVAAYHGQDTLVETYTMPNATTQSWTSAVFALAADEELTIEIDGATTNNAANIVAQINGNATGANYNSGLTIGSGASSLSFTGRYAGGLTTPGILISGINATLGLRAGAVLRRSAFNGYPELRSLCGAEGGATNLVSQAIVTGCLMVNAAPTTLTLLTSNAAYYFAAGTIITLRKRKRRV